MYAALLALCTLVSPAAAGGRVFGWQPWWIDTTPDWSALTHVAWFSFDAAPDGSLTRNGWDAALALREEAQLHGVRFDITVTLFGGDDLHVALSEPARSVLLDNCLAAWREADADGINLDFEGLRGDDRAALTDFALELKARLSTERADAELTLATPAVDWSNAWDYAVLAAQTDGLVVMAYGVHWSSSDPGPLLPLAGGGGWPPYTLGWIIDDYLSVIDPAHHAKVTIALPLYGYDWPSADATAQTEATGSATAVSFSEAWSQARDWRWDQDSQSAWYLTGQAGAWRQAWVDDAAAFRMRVDRVADAGLGLGLWALGYYGPTTNQAVTDSLHAFRGLLAPTSTAETDAPSAATPAQAVDAGLPDGRVTDASLARSADGGVVDSGIEADVAPSAPIEDAGCDGRAAATSGAQGVLVTIALLLLGLALWQTLLMWRQIGMDQSAEFVSRGRYRLVIAALLAHAICIALTHLMPT